MRDPDRRSLLRATAGVLAVGLAGCSSGEPTETPTEPATETPAGTPTPTDGGSGESPTVAVAPGGSLTFDPAELTVKPGTSVTWVWKSGGHNVVVDSQPSEASWGGTAGGQSKLYDEGHTHSFTFEVAGTYDYYCNPHRSAGMTGTVVVE